MTQSDKMASTPAPTLVIYKTPQNLQCMRLMNNWDDTKKSLLTVCPNLRVFSVTADNDKGEFDVNAAPKDLIRYNAWFPMIILVPGQTWDSAMDNLGPNSPIKLKEGVQVLDGHFQGDQLRYDASAVPGDLPSVMAKWLRKALDNVDFKRASGDNTWIYSYTGYL